MRPASKRPKRSIGGLSLSRIFNTDSPITRRETDIQSFLSACIFNWSQYSEEERRTILSTFPPNHRAFNLGNDGQINCSVSSEFLASDTVIRDQIARFKREVSDGYYTKTWQEKARKAMADRTEGKFDQYLLTHAEELFADGDGLMEDETRTQASTDGEYGPKFTNGKARAGKVRKEKDKIIRASSTKMDIECAENSNDDVDELAE